MKYQKISWVGLLLKTAIPVGFILFLLFLVASMLANNSNVSFDFISQARELGILLLLASLAVYLVDNHPGTTGFSQKKEWGPGVLIFLKDCCIFVSFVGFIALLLFIFALAKEGFLSIGEEGKVAVLHYFNTVSIVCAVLLSVAGVITYFVSCKYRVLPEYLVAINGVMFYPNEIVILYPWGKYHTKTLRNTHRVEIEGAPIQFLDISRRKAVGYLTFNFFQEIAPTEEQRAEIDFSLFIDNAKRHAELWIRELAEFKTYGEYIVSSERNDAQTSYNIGRFQATLHEVRFYP